MHSEVSAQTHTHTETLRHRHTRSVPLSLSLSLALCRHAASPPSGGEEEACRQRERGRGRGGERRKTGRERGRARGRTRKRDREIEEEGAGPGTQVWSLPEQKRTTGTAVQPWIWVLKEDRAPHGKGNTSQETGDTYKGIKGQRKIEAHHRAVSDQAYSREIGQCGTWSARRASILSWRLLASSASHLHAEQGVEEREGRREEGGGRRVE
eukprot:3774128-Rhodomonas_salina.1